MHHRLDGQHGAEQRRGGADAPAPLQVVQIVHREPVAEMGTDLLGISLDLFNGLALFLLLRAEVDEQPLPQRSAQGIHRQNLRLREFTSQLLRRNNSGLKGGRQGGGKADAENVFPGFQNGPHGLFHFAYIDGGGGGQLPGADPGIEVLKADIPAVQIVIIDAAAHLQAQRQNLYAQFRRHFRGEVAAAVG